MRRQVQPEIYLQELLHTRGQIDNVLRKFTFFPLTVELET